MLLAFIKRILKDTQLLLSLFALAGFGGILLGVFLGWFLFPMAISFFVDRQTVIKEGTEQYDRWIDVPQPLHFKVYIFNVTNPSEVLEGGIPKVAEIGPYIYREYRHKSISEISPDKTTIVFRGIQTFFFDQKASAPLTESDDLVTLNIQMNCVLQIAENGFDLVLDQLGTRTNDILEEIPIVSTLKHMLPTSQSQKKRKTGKMNQRVESPIPAPLAIINAQLKNVFGEKFASIFMRTTPSELLFTGIPICGGKPTGLTKLICSVIKKLRPKAISLESDGSMKFSMFGFKNNSDDGLFEMYTGVGQMNKLGMIRKLNNRPYLNIWPNNRNGELSVCNIINGTDTTIYPPRALKDFLNIYQTDICRSVKLYYVGEVKFKGISAYRYQVGDDFLRNIAPEYGNECLCLNRINNIPTQANGCLLKGAMDLSVCQGGPIVLTLPHLLGTDDAYQTVIGLHPDINKHMIFAEIEPNTGYPVRGSKRAQLNMFIKKINQIDVTNKLPTVLLPILWVDEGIELNKEMQKMATNRIVIPLLLLKIAHYGLIVGGAFVFIVFSIWYLIRRHSLTKITPITDHRQGRTSRSRRHKHY